jgi:hypothetical protein
MFRSFAMNRFAAALPFTNRRSLLAFLERRGARGAARRDFADLRRATRDFFGADFFFPPPLARRLVPLAKLWRLAGVICEKPAKPPGGTTKLGIAIYSGEVHGSDLRVSLAVK